MSAVHDVHDTDPAPAPGGNGHDHGPPCAVHAAELVELRNASHRAELRDAEARLAWGEIRDAVRALAGTVSDEIDARTKRDAEVTQAILELTAVIGSPPDPTTGKPGTGMRGQWIAAINTVIKSEARREMPSLMDDESEVTGVLDREALVFAKRKAERDRRVMLVRAIVAGVLAIISALVTAAVTLIPLLRGG